MASRHCRVCNDWHDMAEPWPRECVGHYSRASVSGLTIIKDIEPYKNVVDGGVIGSRKQHKDFLRARGMVEVGNELVTKKYDEPKYVDRDIRRAIEEHGGIKHRG